MTIGDKLEKCDLCGAEVSHIHPGRRRDGTPCKICCACSGNLESPIESLIKDVAPLGSFHRVPCFIDEIISLDEGAIMAMFWKAMKEMKAGVETDDVIEKVAIARACAEELDRRGRGHLLAKEAS